ncbi:MAG TPA: DUF5335 family protein, partial [Gemmatimonadaceae bacterium]|nr:DUF5335 family protein [Gemmatimonadaceae bacterium]
LRDELRPHAPPTATVETRTRDGSALGELLAVADEVGADMLAVGTHGPGLIERLFVGSVAAGAIRAAGRTVLVAPAPAAADAAWLELRMRSTTSMRQAAAWEPALEAFSKRNVGRRVRLEVDDPEVGAQVQQSGFALLGVSYDRHDRRVELMMGHANDLSRHLTSSIAHAEDVSFYAGPDGRDRALRVVRGRGQALLTFLD